MAFYENRFKARVGETLSFFARIENAETLQTLDPADVVAIEYSAYKLGTFEDHRAVPVPGHDKVAIPNNAVTSPFITTLFSWQYMFRYKPDVSVAPLFPAPGDYEVAFKISISGGGEVNFTYRVEVE